jgi:predicted RNase H-like HicB family nuclease
MFFVGILDGSNGVWGVRIPDVPGCHGGGATPEEAIADAISALSEMAEIANSVEARDQNAIVADPASEFDRATESLVLLPYLADSGVPVRANISLDARQLAAIDTAAARRGITRSAFLVSAALDKIAAGG